MSRMGFEPDTSRIQVRSVTTSANALGNYLREESSVGTVTGYVQDGRGTGVRIPAGEIKFSLLPTIRTGPLNVLSNGHRGLFPRG
jgi:hypothetical protein